jgi:predicted MPP superfamily phosphohydrolase
MDGPHTNDRGPDARGSEQLRRFIGRTVTRGFDRFRTLPLGRWWHRRLCASVEFSATDVHLSRGGPDLDALTLVYLSDVHAGLFQTRADLARLAARVAALHPDVVCIGGDMIATHFHQHHDLTPLFQLEARLGKFAVPGNHEHFYLEGPGEGLEGWERVLAGHGVRLLVNEGARIEAGESSLWLAGVDDLEEGRPDIDRALRGRHEDEPAILLSHHPDLFVETARRDVDLQVSGHTHGGQIRLFGWAPVTHSRNGFCAGLFERNGSRLYVGRGIGVSFAPVRLGARPEVPLLRLRRGRG